MDTTAAAAVNHGAIDEANEALPALHRRAVNRAAYPTDPNHQPYVYTSASGAIHAVIRFSNGNFVRARWIPRNYKDPQSKWHWQWHSHAWDRFASREAYGTRNNPGGLVS
jgi:hypothetical protein